MGKVEGEYDETRVRVYKKVHKKDEGAMQKAGKFLSKAFTPGSKDKSKEKRLTA